MTGNKSEETERWESDKDKSQIKRKSHARESYLMLERNSGIRGEPANRIYFW